MEKYIDVKMKQATKRNGWARMEALVNKDRIIRKNVEVGKRADWETHMWPRSW